MKIYPVIISALLLSSSVAFLFPRAFAPPPMILNSSWATPAIDGSIGFGEWDLGTRIDFPNGYVTVRNDLIRLYVLVNVAGDTTNDPIASVGDFFWLTFDVDQDKHIDANLDINYGTIAPDSIRLQYYLDAGTWTGVLPSTRSSLGRGFGCFFADGSLQLRFFPFSISCSSHRVWEMGIDLEEIGTAAGGTAEMGLRVHSQNPLFTDDTPADFSNDFHDLTTVNLADSPDPIPAANAAAVISLEANAVEVTQAIQTRDNALSLVEGKKTVARTYVDVNGVGSSQPSKVLLYGTRGGADLPGSPFAMFHMAPTAINRATLSNTANFLIPSSWRSGTVSFKAVVRDFFGNEDSSASFSRTFTNKEIPTYWTIPLNTGTADAPVLPSDSTMSAHESLLEVMWPVRDVNFVRKPWTVIGPTTVAGAIDDLNDYLDLVVLAWILVFIFTGTPPFELPDQIFGFTPAGGGISDPTWCGGRGFVARGGGSIDTLSHETNHNLETTAVDAACDIGTWGRHDPFDCAAPGPDPAWPYANDDIQEVGFDTRTPWATIPATKPDIMSYCTSGTPPKWISPYRWSNLFSNFATVAAPPLLTAPVGLARLVQATPAEKVLYVSGHVSRDRTGQLDPVLVQPGVPSEPVPDGNYAIQTFSPDGQMLSTTPFAANFFDYVGSLEKPRDTAAFSVQIQGTPGIARIRLVQVLPDTVAPVLVTLDEIAVSLNAPTVMVVSPNGGETITGVEQVQWVASDQDDVAHLSFTVLYSPDHGKSWVPVATKVRETSLPVDWSSLPGGSDAMVRVIATDGFNTVTDESDGVFIVPTKAPEVSIKSPSTKTAFKAGEEITFTGLARDTEDGNIADDRLLWSDGDTQLGTGGEMTARLQPGIHQVRLQAVDTNGQIGETSITVVVIAPPPVVVGGPTVPIDKMALVVSWILPVVLPVIAASLVGLMLLRNRKRNQVVPVEPHTVP